MLVRSEQPVAVPSSAGLPERLHALGLPRDIPVALTRNRVTLMSWSSRAGLRLHAGFAAAPDSVLFAMVRFVARRVPRAERLAARRIFMAFPVEQHVPSRPPPHRGAPVISPADQPLVAQLIEAHRQLNQKHFAGTLTAVPIYLSGRMRRRLGELRVPRDGGAPEIVISRRHIRRDGWTAALDTLLHEMVHQWQAQTGRPIDHRAEFRRMAKAVGIAPRAVADLHR